MSRVLLLFFVFLLTDSPCAVGKVESTQALSPTVIRTETTVRNGKLLIDADIDFALNDELREAVMCGVPLYFTADLVITHSRWWWVARTVVDTTQTWRIVYNALTRQWRAGTGELSLPVASLEEAMDRVRHIRNWSVADADSLEQGVRYEGRLRVRLDTSLLARPFQVNALNSSAWSPATPWSYFAFALAESGQEIR